MSSIQNVQYSNEGSRLTFDIKDLDVGFLNSLRRVILSEIPNVAINFESYNITNSDINFIKNTSVLHNEITGHRISLIPLCFSSDEIDTYDPEAYKFVLNEKGPKLVTTKDIKIYDADNVEYPKEFHDKIFPSDRITKKHIIITKLKNEDEVIHAEFRARIGIAKKHAAWSPVSTCTFFNNIDEVLVEKERKKATDANNFETLEKYRLFSKNEFGEPNSFNMIIESECRLDPQYLFKKAISVLTNKLESILKSPTIELIDPDSHMWVVTVVGENHTIGNLFQVAVFNTYVRNEQIVDYIGYVQPHPLEEKIVFKIRFYNEMTDSAVLTFLEEAVENIRSTLSTIPVTLLETNPKSKKIPKTKKTK